MIKSFLVLAIIVGQSCYAFCQDTTAVYFNSYSKRTSNASGVFKLVVPKNDTVYYSGESHTIKFPNEFKYSDTAFTTIFFTGNPNSIFSRELGVLVGDYKSKKPTFYIDRNGNNNYSDDGKPIVFLNDSILDVYLDNSEDPNCKFGVRLFYRTYKFGDQKFLSQMGPLAKKNQFASIEYWLGEFRLNNRINSITVDSFIVLIGLHDYNCNGTYNDVGKDKVIFGNKFDNSISTRLQHGAIVISDTTRVLINNVVYDIREIAKDGSALTLIKCKDSCRIEKKIQNGMKLTHTALVALDSSNVYLDEIQDSNKYLLIDVWGLWCKACINQLPRLEELYRERKENLQIVSLNWGDYPQTVYTYLNENASHWPDQLFANKQFLKDYMVDSYPNYILVGKDGVIIKLGTNLTEVKEIIGE
ncbi:MAG: thiol-disulfide isomerase/thioredoxin [Bacteroidia bacterium]|jgi:thiol-disulfide isomerase/thioredoxin